MRKDFIVLDFVRFPIAQKIEFTRNVCLRLKGNPRFGALPVTVEELQAKNELLETRSLAAQGGGKEATALMHQTEEELMNMLRKIARYVDTVADGDSALILNAGFNLAKQPAPAVRPEFSVELGPKPGCVLLQRQAQEGARSYIWQYCTGDSPSGQEADWKTAQVTSRASTELTGLTPLTRYWFRVAVVTIGGTGPYTQPIMQVVI